MKYQIRCAVLTLLFCTLHAKILRNNALMNKMISHYQQDKNLSSEPTREVKKERHSHDVYERRQRQNMQERQESQVREDKEEIQEKEERQEVTLESQQRPEKVLNLMRHVLCKNFPTIPCKFIMQDGALSKLIERSIQQIAVKKLRMEQTTTVSPREFHPAPTLYPLINSEDLSNFLEVSNTGYFNEEEAQKKTKKKKKRADKKVKNPWSHEGPSKKKLKGSKDTRRGTELYTGRKKMRKFYPHKIKYKDKTSKTLEQGTFKEYGEDKEKVSMSSEMPDAGTGVGGLAKPKTERLAYKVGQADSPVWRIDYMKHGVPSLKMFEYDDGRIRGKIMKTGPNVITDENGLEQPVIRKEVLHPDVYIKKNNFSRKRGTNIKTDILE